MTSLELQNIRTILSSVMVCFFGVGGKNTEVGGEGEQRLSNNTLMQ